MKRPNFLTTLVAAMSLRQTTTAATIDAAPTGRRALVLTRAGALGIVCGTSIGAIPAPPLDLAQLDFNDEGKVDAAIARRVAAARCGAVPVAAGIPMT